TPVVFTIALHAVMCRPAAEKSEISWVLRTVPLELRPVYQQQCPDPAAHRAALLKIIDEAMTELRSREEQLRTGPERLRAQTMWDQAVLIEDPQKARLWLRYSSESQSLFFQATRELRQAQE